jgi:YidC/Oxa1 family membrane protein insertase
LGISEIWTSFFLQPMLNSLLWLYSLLWHNFAVSIAVFTIAIRLITLPLTIPQMTSSKKMQNLQPKLKELKKKHGDDKEAMTKAQMALYKEAGVNPMGGCLPMLVQFPIWIGLYQSIYQTMAVNPTQVLNLSQNIYLKFPTLSQMIPLNDQFLWLDLGRPDPYYILPVLVAASMFFQQKLMTTPTADPSSESMTKSMTYTMPLMFGFFSLQFSSGLSIYFIISSLVGVAIQLGINKAMGLGPNAKAAPTKSKANGKDQKQVSTEPSSEPLPAATVVDGEIVETTQLVEGSTEEATGNNGDTQKEGKRRRARKKRR